MWKEDKVRNRDCICAQYIYIGILSAVITMATLLLAMSYCQMLGGKLIYIKGDLFEQCAPFAHLFADKIIEGSNLYYSFNIGFGMNTSLLFAFYVFSPFNILYLLSNGDNINSVAIAVLILKTGMAAFGFCIYSKYNLGAKKIVCVLFSMGYALSSYGLVSSDMIALYDGIYLLPLVLVAIKRLVDSKKSFLLIVLYTVLFVSNFYSGYIVGLASFGYFLIYLLFFYKTKEKRIHIVARYSYSLVCAGLLSSFILVPAFFEALGQDVIEDSFNFSIVPIWNAISFLFPFHTYELYKMTPYYYCGIPAALLLGAFFTHSTIRVKYKIIAGITCLIALLSMSFQPLYSAAHMFNDPTGFTFRYAYIIAFVTSSMGIIALNNIQGVNLKKTLICDSCIMIIHFMTPFFNRKLGIYNNYISPMSYVITMILVAIWIYLLILYKRSIVSADGQDNKTIKNIAIISIIIISFEICFNSWILLKDGHQNEEEYKYRVEQADLLIDELDKMDSSFYRVHYEGLMNTNQSCLYDYYGSTMYSSSSNNVLKNFLYNIGISCSEFFVFGKGTTDLAQLLLDEKYDLGAYITYNEWNENYIEENPVVGLGFMVDERVIDVEIGEDVFENQNNIYSALYGEEITPFISYNGEVLVEGENCSTSFGEADNIIFSLEEEASIGNICLKVPAEKENDMYAWLSSGDNSVVSGSPVLYSPDVYMECEYVKPLLMAPHIIKMTREDDANEIYVYLATNTVKKAVISDYKFAYYDDSYIYELWDKLSKQVFDVTSFEDGYVEGNITALESGICFLSVPYEEGWTVKVDGVSCEITPLFDDAFIGVPLEAGYHDIVLCFEAPYSSIGKKLSLIGLLLLMAIMFVEIIRNKNNGQMCGK